MSFELGIVLVLILTAELVNGWTDAPNAIATVVGTGALTFRQAIVMACVFDTIGVLSGTAVAVTIGEGIVDPNAITLTTVGSAMVGIVAWSAAAARWGIPTSESHALVAGLGGAALATAGPSALVWEGWSKVLVGLAFSGLLGFVLGFAIVVLLRGTVGRMGWQRSREHFRWLQIASSAFVAFSHGSNDGQKFIGAFALALLLGGAFTTFHIPLWVVLLCAVVMAVGTSMGAARIIQTLGTRLTSLGTHQGFAAEVASGSTITLASALGVPLSTTHTISTAIVGSGVVNGARAVDWRVVRRLATAWVITFPVCGAIGWAAVNVARALPVPLQVVLSLGAIVALVLTLVRARHPFPAARQEAATSVPEATASPLRAGSTARAPTASAGRGSPDATGPGRCPRGGAR
jgi:PiT family inorganic phosphate transporter